MPLGLAALAFVLALVQRPGWATSDTKIDLHVDPSGFLSDVASVWTPSGALGHVQGGQYSGYLFPMGPFFALGHLLGIPDWVVGRLWLGLLIALAAWGVVRLLDALYAPDRGVAHVVAGVLMVLNPYVVVFSNQTSVTLLGYAALPWLLLIVHRGLRNPRGWWWPAALALLFTCIGGGVNAAVVAWLIPAALLMALHEPLRGHVPWRALWQFALRAVPLALLASLWWVVPVLVQSGYGIDFLKFTEQQGAIWSTTGLSEALRLMSYWISYVGVGFGAHPEPYFSDSATLLFDLPVVIATLLVPALALSGFVWTRRWRYGPFFLAMVLVGLVTMTVGFPEGTPLRSAANFTYNHVAAVQFLRTTYKAAPMVALGLACLGGVAAAQAWARLARAAVARRVALALAAAVLVGLAAWPLVSGRALESKLSWKAIPSAWRQAAGDLDRGLPPNTRAVVLPGQLFSFYRWGGTVDPILPALTDKPVAVRSIVPYADLRAIDMLWTTDTLLQQQRVLPGQLRPLLGLMSAGAVVQGTDDDRNRSGSMPAAEAAGLLDGQGLGTSTASYGQALGFRPSAQMLGPTVRLPEVRRFDVSSGTRGLVRLESGGRGSTVVDGSAQALAALASFGALPPAGAPSFYAADRTASQIRSARDVVISDSNRRRSFLSSQIQGNVGPTMAASEPLSPDAAALNPFPDAGTDAQTVAQYQGAAYLRAPLSPQFTQFPEHRPFAAFDGSTHTSWLADPEIDKSRSWIEIGFTGERAVDHIDLAPHDDSRARVTAVAVAGKRFDVHPGWNRLQLGLPAVRSLRVTIVGLRKPPDLPRGAGGIDEIRVPGLAVHERLRPPVLATRALAGSGSGSRLTYLFDRTTADEPYRTGTVVNDAQLRSRLDRQDPEPRLSRTFELPRATSLTADTWTSIDPLAPDPAIDRFAGYRGGARFTSSSRFDGVPGFRASGAFDGDPARGWIGTWIPARPAWLAWHTQRPATVRSLRLTRLAQPVRFPTRVRVVTDGGAATPALAVGRGGEVTLPRAVRSRTFRIDVLAAAFPPGTPRAELGRRAVGIADVAGGPHARMPRTGAARFACGDAGLRLGARTLRLRPRASVEQIDAGAPIRAAQCGGSSAALPAGTQHLDGVAGPVRVDHAMLRSPPSRVAAPVPDQGAARVTDPGSFGRSEISGVRLAGANGHWLVLGQSYNRGWRAYCGDHSLGKPVAIDGFANGWRVDRDCPEASFRFEPQRAVQWGYWISGIACLLLLAFLVIRRRRRGPVEALDRWLPARESPARMALPRAAAVAVPAALLLAFLFALRAGPPVWLGLTLILWRGIGARTLTLAAGALLAVAVPVLYVLFPGPDRGGFNPEYAVKHLGAHWVSVAAYVLLAAALARTLSTASRASGDRPGERAA
ncbi:MAG: arabinofuranan 3-O-arabinosyltransferase [Thermoleophilaceae bacterium]|nr:arabinofuranan 3-O-arabinosyltransferase [Thermoleophilaceae bacterium]